MGSEVAGKEINWATQRPVYANLSQLQEKSQSRLTDWVTPLKKCQRRAVDSHKHLCYIDMYKLPINRPNYDKLGIN